MVSQVIPIHRYHQDSRSVYNFEAIGMGGCSGIICHCVRSLIGPWDYEVAPSAQKRMMTVYREDWFVITQGAFLTIV